MKKNKSVSAPQFNGLHRLILEKSDEILKKAGYLQGLNRENDQLLYGYMAGETNQSVQSASIKHAMMLYLQSEKYPFDGFHRNENDSVKFNGRVLRDLYFELRTTGVGGKVSIPEPYLEAYLYFVGRKVTTLPEEHVVAEAIGPSKLKKGASSITRQKHIEDYWSGFDRALSGLLNTTWYLYEYDIQLESDKPAMIVRNRFRILDRIADDTYDIKVEILKNPPFADFEGRIVYSRSNPKILILRLHTKNYGVKYMEIMLHVEATLSKELYIGLMLRYDDRDSVISNTVILHKQTADFETLTSVKLQNTEAQCTAHQVPPAISRFLKNKFQNVLRIPSGISTVYDLERWLLRKGGYPKKTYTVEPVNDLFIACPISGLKGKEDVLRRLREEITAMRQNPLLQEIGLRSTYCPLCDEQELMKEPENILSDELEYFRECKALLVILDTGFEGPSSIYIQVGWAMQAGKPIFIIGNRDLVPRLLKNGSQDNKIFINAADNPVAIADVPRWLKENRYNKYF